MAERRSFWGRTALSVILSFLLNGIASPHAPSLEYQVKASYLYNFIQFIEWPQDVFSSDGFQLCVLGPDPFGEALEPLREKRAGSREIVIRRLPEWPAPGRCHMVFVTHHYDGYPGLDAIAGRGVLTIGETPDFLQQGGIIKLAEKDGRIRFRINKQAAERAGLQVSARLLDLSMGNR